MSLPDNNLRKLSAAHSRGLIDSPTYRRLRTAQLGALEFNRQLPGLPDEMTDITIPKQKIDAPHMPIGQKSSSMRIVWVIIILAAVAGGTYYYLNFVAQ